MMDKTQLRKVRITIDLPMEFPEEWGDEAINFHLNGSSWCWSNLLNLLYNYASANGCLCNICEGEVLPNDIEVG